MAVELAVTGVPAFTVPRQARGGCRGHGDSGRLVKKGWVTPSPLWGSVSSSPTMLDNKKTTTPIIHRRSFGKKNQYRLKSHTPSYCDESLFGPPAQMPGWDAPWVWKEERTKVRPLLWSPPTIAPSSTHAPPAASASHPPVKSVAPETKSGSAEFLSYQGKTDFWKRRVSEEEEEEEEKEQGESLKGRPASAFSRLGVVQRKCLSPPNRRPLTTDSIKTRPHWKY